MLNFNLYDSVILKIEEEGVPSGSIGVIVHKYDGVPIFEVEFFDDKMVSIGVFSINQSKLEQYTPLEKDKM